MRPSTICLGVLSTAAILVSSRPSASYLRSFWALLSPSYSSGPSQCTESTCGAVQNAFDVVCSIPPSCTQLFEPSYYTCLLCINDASLNATELDELYVSCHDYNFPDRNPFRNLSTSTYAGSSTTVGTSITMSMWPRPSKPTAISKLSPPSESKTFSMWPESITMSMWPPPSEPRAISISSLPSEPTIISMSSSPSELITTSITLPSSALHASSGTTSGTITSSTPPPTGSSAALGLTAGRTEAWLLIAGAIGLIVL
ncbi:hypothetical protein BDR05DRAFT_145581 [Suillus weaverae]|nr:hypothetical protein BDR05DRAFT_145581 [Suillus weaverae]